MVLDYSFRILWGFLSSLNVGWVKAGVGKYRAVKKLLPGRAELRPNWSKNDWNDWHKKHAAGAIDDHNPYGSSYRACYCGKTSQDLSLNQCNDDWGVVINFHMPNIQYFNEGPSVRYCQAETGLQYENVAYPWVINIKFIFKACFWSEKSKKDVKDFFLDKSDTQMNTTVASILKN